LYLASAFSFAAVLTYFPSGILVPIVLIWVLGAFGWRMLLQKHVWILFAVAISILAPLLILAGRWSPAHLNAVISPLRNGGNAGALLFYSNHVTELVYPTLLVFAFAGLLVTICTKTLRSDCIYLLVWIAVCYLGFSFVSFLNIRY